MTVAAVGVPTLALCRGGTDDIAESMWLRSYWYNRIAVTSEGMQIVAASVLRGIECDGTFEIGRREPEPLSERLEGELAGFIDPRGVPDDTPLEALDPRGAVVPTGYAVEVHDEHVLRPDVQRPYAVLRAAPFTVVVYQVEEFDLWLNVYFASKPIFELMATSDESLGRRLFDLDFAATQMHEI